MESALAEVYFERTSEVTGFIAPLIRADLEPTVAKAEFRAALLTMQHERLCYLWILRGMPYDAEVTTQTLGRVWFEHIGNTAG